MVSHFLRRKGWSWPMLSFMPFVGSMIGPGLERKEHWKKNSDGRNPVILKKGRKLPTNCQ